MIPGLYFLDCGKSNALGDSPLRALPHMAGAAGRRIDQGAPSACGPLCVSGDETAAFSPSGKSGRFPRMLRRRHDSDD